MADDAPNDQDLVHVQFVDQATGQVFAESPMPPGRLPESFEARTTLHLGEDDWEVVEARPVTAADFRRSRKLTLILRRVVLQKLGPGEILFSLPTITNDALPDVAAGSSKLGRDVIEIHEDNWRQIEWIAGSESDAIAAELDAIREVHLHERNGVGFKRVHLRKAITEPLVGVSFTIRELQQVIGPQATWLPGFAYQDIAGIADSSFAVRMISSIELFGIAPGGVVQRVCFANTQANNVPQPDVRNLAAFAAAHDLMLVDWCAVAAIPPVEDDYATYFRGSE